MELWRHEEWGSREHQKGEDCCRVSLHSNDTILIAFHEAMDIICNHSRSDGIDRPGIMHQGLFRINHPDVDLPAMEPAFIPCTLSCATNIRHLVIDFKGSRTSEDILPFTPFGRVTFSPNYFIAPFLKAGLKRMEMLLPERSLTRDSYVLLLREKKLEFGIKGLNMKLGVVGCLESVNAGYEQDDDTIEDHLDWLGEDNLWEERELSKLEGR